MLARHVACLALMRRKGLAEFDVLLVWDRSTEIRSIGAAEEASFKCRRFASMVVPPDMSQLAVRSLFLYSFSKLPAGLLGHLLTRSECRPGGLRCRQTLVVHRARVLRGKLD